MEESPTCYEGGETGHFKKGCPWEKSIGGDGRVLMITAGETLPEPPMIIGTFHSNNVYSLIFIKTSAN